MTEVIRPIETKLDQKYLENAIEEIQNMYREPTNIPDWIFGCSNHIKGGFKTLASIVNLQQETMQNYHDDSDNWEFEFPVTDEMISDYKENE